MRIDHKRASLIAASSAMFMTLMDTQIVNVALATVTRDLHTVTSSAQWVITSYSLSLAVFIPASGWVGDRFGTRRVFLTAIALFTSASVLCALAPSITTLIIARIVQGAGGGMLFPVGMAMMYRAYPQAERIHASKTMTMIVAFAPASAPLIGGLIVTELSWRWIFLVNVPIGIALLLFTFLHVQDYRRDDAGRYDPAGLLLGGPGLAAVLYAISEGPSAGWGAARVLITGILGLILLAGFVRVELKRRDPLLDLRLFGQSAIFRRCCGIQMCQSLTFFGSLVFTNLYVQETRGYSALLSGTVTFPEAMAVMLSSRVVGRFYKRIGPRRLLSSGCCVMVVGSLLLADLGPDTNLWLVRAVTFMLGCGNALILLPVQASIYSEISTKQTGHASAIYGSLSRAAQAASVAILSSVLALSAGQSLHPAASDFHAVFFVGAGVAVIGLYLAWGVRDSDAANTLAPSDAETALAEAEAALTDS